MAEQEQGNQTAEKTVGVSTEVWAEDWYVKNVVWKRKTVMDALAAGKSACLPNEQGYADTSPATNLINNTPYKGMALLYLKEVQRQRGFPTAEFVSTDQIDKAGEAQGKQVYKAKGEKGITIPYKEQDKETGEWVPKHKTLFNMAQLSNPEVVRDYAKDVQQQNKTWAEENSKTLRKPWHENEITCTSSEPKEYLGQYLAAISFGARFKASQEQAAEFVKKTEQQVFEPSQTGKPNPMNILKLSNQATTYAKEYRDQVIEERMTAVHERQQQQQQQQQPARKQKEAGFEL